MRKKQVLPLNKLNVIFLDIQTSAARPKNGSIIEFGWAVSGNDQIRSFLIQPKKNEIISKRINFITGISQGDLNNADKIGDVYRQFTSTAQTVAGLNGSSKCPIVIHYAKFEEPFIRHLHKAIFRKAKLPFDFICTHEICRRLMPSLPRRGIRAVSGFFGHGISEQRRSSEHVKATILIWQKLTVLLKEKYGVINFDDLKKWLADTRPKIKRLRLYPFNIKHSKFPDRPGIYRMHRSNGSLLYIGKATSLKTRISSYFRKKARHAEHILEMLSQVGKITYRETKSVLEAALVESDEIKIHKPPYNIALRERERNIWFCDSDLKDFTHNYARSRSIGPFDSPGAIKTLGLINMIVQNSDLIAQPGVLTDAFGLPEQYAPETGMIKKGFKKFIRKHRSDFKPPFKQSLAQLANGIWVQRREELEEESNDDSDDEIEEFEWTPETVACMLESHVCRGFHVLRKSRWLCWLTESTIIWDEKINRKRKRFTMVFHRGAIKKHQGFSDKNKIQVPPGYRKKFRQRQRNFDLMTLDRMRIIAAAIRKMLNEGKMVKAIIRDKTLDEKILKKIYKWI